MGPQATELCGESVFCFLLGQFTFLLSVSHDNLHYNSIASETSLKASHTQKKKTVQEAVPTWSIETHQDILLLLLKTK